MIVTEGAVPPFDFDGLAIRDYTAGRVTSSSFAVIDVEPGAAHRVSWSRRSDKYYYVVSGTVEFADSGQIHELSAGDFCLVAQGERFSYRNVSDRPARLCLFHTPNFDLDSEIFEQQLSGRALGTEAAPEDAALPIRHASDRQGGILPEPFWERTYSDLGTATFCDGMPSQEIRDIAAELPRGAKVLDLGCGEGRNALFLAECGFDVTAADISHLGIRKLDALAKQRGLEIRSQVADMRCYAFEDSFDLIVSHGCLHLIERPSWEQLVSSLKAHTTSGGVNVVVVFTDSLPPPDDLKDFCLGLFHEGEVFDLYSDWAALLQQTYVFEDEHPGNLRHTHAVNKLVARKPSNKPAQLDGLAAAADRLGR
jgi:tellurite methyltransferase